MFLKVGRSPSVLNEIQSKNFIPELVVLSFPKGRGNPLQKYFIPS